MDRESRVIAALLAVPIALILGTAALAFAGGARVRFLTDLALVLGAFALLVGAAIAVRKLFRWRLATSLLFACGGEVVVISLGALAEEPLDHRVALFLVGLAIVGGAWWVERNLDVPR